MSRRPRAEKALQGKLDGYLGERVLLEQSFVRDQSITIRELIDTYVQKFGEKIEVTRFERLSVR